MTNKFNVNIYQQVQRFDNDINALAEYMDMSPAEVAKHVEVAFLEDMPIITPSQIRLSRMSWSLEVDLNPTPPRCFRLQRAYETDGE